MKHLRHALIFGFIIGIVSFAFLFSPFGRYLEDEVGLSLLFKIRGPLPPPAEVVIINIDDDSSEQLNLPSKVENWPRNVYADLVATLSDLGVAVIVFDIHFGDAQDSVNDRKFADAMQAAGNVILYQKMVRKITGPSPNSQITTTVDIEQEIPPAQVLADAALASASFPIPKMPVRVNQAWTFKTSAGDMPTLPVITLQALALGHYESFYGYISEQTNSSMAEIPKSVRQVTEQTGLMETMRRYRQLLSSNSETSYISQTTSTTDSAGTKEERLFQALAATYRGGNNIYINFYGPPSTIKTYSLLRLLSDDTADSESLHTALKNKVVFVGTAKTTWSEQKDGFYTVFTQPDGLDLSGVEIAATVFANLLDSWHLKPPPLSITALILICSAIIFAVTAFTLNTTASAVVLAGLISICIVAANQLMTLYALRLPVITWIVLVPPIIFFSAIIFKFVRVQRERTHIKQALHLYLPDNVVEEISSDLSFIKTGDRMVYGVCLSTDAQNYTSLSEKLEPIELSAVMKNYFKMIFKSVNNHDGLVCNVVGDAMFAMWPSTDPNAAGKRKACLAALDIIDTIEAFNNTSPKQALPTRIGLHSGYLLMGNIGAEGHYEYAPVGDIVNTTTRIENLNKKLGTWILASEQTVNECEVINTRLMGTFLMSGKSNPITLYQVLPPEIDRGDKMRFFDEMFTEALDLFQSKKWDNAESMFRKCLAIQKDDGPSIFYCNLCRYYRTNPPVESWKGVITLHK